MDNKKLKRLTWFIICSVEALILLFAFVSITRAQVRNAPPYYGALDGTVYFPVTNRGFNYSVTAQQLKDSLGGGSDTSINIGNSDLTISRPSGTFIQRTLRGDDSTTFSCVIGSGNIGYEVFALGNGFANMGSVANDSSNTYNAVLLGPLEAQFGELPSSGSINRITSSLRIFKPNNTSGYPGTVLINSSDKTLYLSGNYDGSGPGGLDGGVILDFSKIGQADQYRRLYFPNDSGTFLLDRDTSTFLGTKHDFLGENLQKVTDRGATTNHSITARDYIIDDGSSGYSGSVVFKYDDGTTNSMSENDGGRYIEYHNGSATTDGNPAGWRFGGQVMGAPATRDSNFVTLLQMRDSICNGSCSGSGKNIGTDNLEIMDSSRYLTYKPGVFSSGIVVGDTTSAFGSYFKMGRVTSFIRNNASPFSIINAGGGINILDSSAVGMNVYSGYNLDISTGAAMSISSNQDMTFNSFNATVNAGGSIGLTSTGGMITVSTPAPIQLSSGSSPIQLYAGAGAPIQISTDAGSNGVNLFTHNVTGFQSYEMPNESGTVLLDADTATLLATKNDINHRPETYTGADTITADGESGFFTITTTIPAGATYYNIVATDSGTAGVLKTTGYFLSQSGSSLSINFVTPPAAGTYKIKWIAVY